MGNASIRTQASIPSPARRASCTSPLGKRSLPARPIVHRPGLSFLMQLAVLYSGLTACVPAGDPSENDEWLARVTATDDLSVCTENLVDVPDWHQRSGDDNCFERSNPYTKWDALELKVGDCVILDVHHPSFVIESEVECTGGHTESPRAR